MDPLRPISPASTCHPGGDSLESICVLGIGNVLWADEGFGVRCIEALQQRYEFAPHVQLIDGGTQGLYLVQHVQQADRLLIFDAIDYGLAPGELKLVLNEDVPRFMGAKKMSLHQTGFQEVLMLALLTEKYPKEVLLIGCQPQEIEDYGGSLRPVVKQALEDALALGLDALRDWGAQPTPRQRPLSDVETVTFAELALGRYEAERPPEDLACRSGDERFMPVREAG
ncbi:HyaD/HybD family hydrogenase maturation endopeptidase [Roseateles puraquae]|uniref:Hydrogenase expression/formation protein n=1 Tax=Roseateles puraquae TaxID=431059 RepID=A0A254MZF2_9BURK|nr:HyaD/HybD family hydrogenase maturation endopeptidase [Roseateles puraquae]MDG0854348.1 HyaD/HybD family hydrogenase maturation endopeptidase [Roseateles puraquae]OWR00753.1 hydrogenase expression/formation protein [Roseateles puraquae]RTL46780.1 MAG: HyaD/HybD family hydrogenase maturation endopeptidase [Burkholderiales bacterium]